MKAPEDITLDDWIEALESGKYKQAKGKLCKVSEDNEYTFCCLGVLCDLKKAEWQTIKNRKSVRSTYIDGILLSPTSFPVDQIKEVLPKYESFKLAFGLAKMNDTGKSFIQIARDLRYLQDHNSLPTY